MFSESKFSELSESLASGFFADKVVLSLAQIEKRGEIKDKDIKIFNQIDSFLKNVLNGFNWINNPSINEDSIKFAKAFSDAVRAKPNIKFSKEFEQYINSLLQISQSFKVNWYHDEKKVDVNKVKHLRKFFTAYGRAELIRSQNLINGED